MTVEYNGESLRANGGAFMNCSSLQEIIIPASVHTIECNAFCNCTSLESVTFENNSNLKYLKGMAHMPYRNPDTYGGCFSNCKMLKSIILPKKVMEIGVVAFGGSGLEEVYIESVVPPTLKSRTNAWDYTLSENFPKSCIIFVPAQYYEVYKEKTGWKDISSRIYPYEF